jgi:hypothetical protein
VWCRDGDDEAGGSEALRVTEPPVQGRLLQQQQLRQRVQDGELPRRRVQGRGPPAQVLLQEDLLAHGGRDAHQIVIAGCWFLLPTFVRCLCSCYLCFVCFPLWFIVPCAEINCLRVRNISLLFGIRKYVAAACWYVVLVSLGLAA